MDHHRNVEVFNELPKWARLIVVRVVTFMAGMNEYAFQSELAHGALGLLDECRPATRQDRGKTNKRAFVFFLHLGRVVAPALRRGQFLACRLAPQIMRGIGHDAYIDAGLAM